MNDRPLLNLSGQAKRDRSIILAAFFGFVFLAILSWFGFYPGTMSPDSYEQYEQAQSFRFDAHHPPAMAALWSALLPIKDGPQPMLILQIGLYFTCWFLLFKTFWSSGQHRLAIAIGLCSLAPFCLNFVGVIWKDVHNALPWFFVAIIAIFFPPKSKLSIVLLLVALWYGWMVRGNAILAVLPLIFLVFHRKERKMITTGGMVVIVFALFFVGKTIVHDVMLKPSHSDPYSRAMVHDLAGIKHYGGDPTLPPTLVSDNPRLERQLSHYEPGDIKSILFENPDGNILLRKSNPDAMVDLRSAWLASVTGNPLAYARHRLAFSVDFVHLFRGRGYYLREIHFPEPAKAAGVPTAYPMPSKVMQGWPLFWERWPFMQGWFWVLGLIGLGILGLRLRATSDGQKLLALSSSGILYLGPHFVFGQAADFRYFYWAIFCAILGVIILLASRSRKRAPEAIQSPS